VLLFATLAAACSARAAGTAAALRHAGDPEAGRPASDLSASVENTDAALSAALFALLLERTPERLTAVAHRYYQLGIRDKAMDYYSEALDVDQRYVAALDGRARVWRDWGRYGEALGDAYRATHAAPQSARAWNTLGTILQAAGRVDEAEKAYRFSTMLQASASYAWNNLCYLSFLKGRSEQAISECSTAVEDDPQFGAALNNLALTYAALGDDDRAFELFSRGSDEATARFNVGVVRLARKDYAGAVAAFEAAYHIKPDFQAAHAAARRARLLNASRMETPNARP
jgi:Flp pilus assembly protein TadD